MLISLSPAQCRAARALISLTQPKLAAAAGVGLSTVVDFERGRRQVSAEAVEKIEQAIRSFGVELIDENGGGAGVRLRDRL